MNLKELTSIAKDAALHAGLELLKVYHSADFGVELKGDDSPLTKADRAAHELIVSYLEKTGIPILSEEGKAIPTKSGTPGTISGWLIPWMVRRSS